ncbi:hypothetical protein SAMN05444365_101328 [Micromonospora pattaloongensis]|uniref:Uncharacterized protein n=1 Tax=Micromonospora pattaloongensis TaxID=405436 RepID=A0A1H3G9N1_9ACTN|nr:hypothetical protein [Micromonospora pattaloongensis]SDX99760.1 hypothetical protein SAMN05444365_101328 [Micromonospora pattaloongensis]
MRNIRIAVPVLLACLALTACGQAGTGTSDPATEPGGATVTTSPSQPTPSDAAPPTKGSPSGATTTLTGTITPGVEPGCLLLDGYLLVGGPTDVLRDGARVTVTGRVQPDVMTTCQQGTPFMVESAKTA